jgi:hypothetical protein
VIIPLSSLKTVLLADSFRAGKISSVVQEICVKTPKIITKTILLMVFSLFISNYLRFKKRLSKKFCF